MKMPEHLKDLASYAVCGEVKDRLYELRQHLQTCEYCRTGIMGLYAELPPLVSSFVPRKDLEAFLNPQEPPQEKGSTNASAEDSQD